MGGDVGGTMRCLVSVDGVVQLHIEFIIVLGKRSALIVQY